MADGDNMPAEGMPEDVADTGVAADVAMGHTAATSNQSSPARPGLQRNQLPPPNPQDQGAAAAAAAAPGNTAPDSLSLAQLRRIVSEFPKTETIAYDFVYSDTGPHGEEIDEWFVYQFWQSVRLNKAQRAFEGCWEAQNDSMLWEEVGDGVRSKFVRDALQDVAAGAGKTRIDAVATIMYIVAGRWEETAGASPLGDKAKARTVAAPAHLAAIKEGVWIVAETGGLPVIWSTLQTVLDSLWNLDIPRATKEGIQEMEDDLMNLMTITYLTLQEIVNDREGMARVRDRILALNPNITIYLFGLVAKMRWMDGPLVPLTQSLLLLWKSILVEFGGSEEIEETKKALRETPDDEKDKDTITASPLDYHTFRQEISSKYPSYVPPQLPIPLEAETTTLLPPLPNHPTRNNGQNGIMPTPSNGQSGGASILHQPVHIATPAPSPPPSPAVGGKGGKKQNYQTNQNFPFMYPPLDASSNSAGGKGGAGLLDPLVGRKWEGSDIPASILEAGKLFSERVRMTRATRQLWEEREKFLKFERGWEAEDDDLDELDLDALSIGDNDAVDDDKLLEAIERRTKRVEEPNIDFGPRTDLDADVQQRLRTIESFYAISLPQIQSVVVVLMKAVLFSVTSAVAAPQGRGPEGLPNSARPNGSAPTDAADLPLDELDQARAREIEGKALTGILILLLKWFKISHVLKFEYLTQLLLDSNYLPLILKLFAHQDVQQVVDSKTDRIEHSFFHFCNHRAQLGENHAEPTEIDGLDEISEDDAAPPPIKRRKSPPRSTPAVTAAGEPAAGADADNSSAAPVRPEVDELGYPINAIPQEPITDFSPRNFFSLINYLRVLQKICKNKAHRNLLLVQYKSSNIIKKTLKMPQPELRLYTLKLFKNQVPYCGRKWRQSNMRVITAVYLYCRPELRDEWLAGSDVDAEVEEALPLEQALRSLTHWFNVRRYPDNMPAEVIDALQNEQDFFKRELERFEVSWPEGAGGGGGGGGGGGAAESVNGDWEQSGAANGW